MGLTYPSAGAYPNGFWIVSDKFSIAFYAFCIIGGALVALLLSTWESRKDGFSLDFFITIFLIAFPMGIIGARIWYVIAEWPYFAANPDKIFAFKQGGLAIQGGALLGVISGVTYGIFRRRGVSIFKTADYAVPTILVAQAIGRWGNFFNQEVYGNAVNPDAWSFLPGFINQNMNIRGNYYVPLFLVEGILNLSLFFIIVYGYRNIFKKFYKAGDSVFLYFIAYGFIRLIMEPMRNSQFIMGNGQDKMNSLYMAIAFIVVGAVCFVANHVIRYLSSKGKFDSVPALKKVGTYLDYTTEGFDSNKQEDDLSFYTYMKNKQKDSTNFQVKEGEYRNEEKERKN